MSALLVILQILAYISIVLLLVYIIIELRFIVKNLPVDCDGKTEFDPTLNYIASFDFPSIIEKITNVKTIKGSITGTKSSSSDGEFTITFLAYKSGSDDPEKSVFPGQKYTYDKSTCTLTYTFYEPPDGTHGVQDYLNKYKIELSPSAYLVPNNGIRLTGNYVGVVNIPIAVTAYPGNL